MFRAVGIEQRDLGGDRGDRSRGLMRRFRCQWGLCGVAIVRRTCLFSVVTESTEDGDGRTWNVKAGRYRCNLAVQSRSRGMAALDQ